MRNKLLSGLAYGFVAIYVLAASLVSLHRFWQFEVFYYDFGIYDQALWNVSRFRPPVIDHFVIPGKVIFADHFSPSMFLLTPLYWITSRPEILLVAQAVAVGLSGLVLWYLGKYVLKSAAWSLAVTVGYLLFVGTQNALISDIHEITFMMLPLMLALYAVVTKRPRLFWISFIITLGFKESSALLGIGLAALIYFHNRKWAKTAIAVAVLSVAWGWLTTQVIIPYFYGRRYFYTPTLPSNPLLLIFQFADDPVKRKTLFYSLASFGFLPLLYPPAFLLILQDLAARFLQSDYQLRWGLGLHYSAQLSVILAFSTVMAMSWLSRRLPKKSIVSALAAILIVITLILHRFVLRGPLGLAYNPAFYRNTKNFAFLNNLIAKVPKGSTVMTMNNIAPHMIHTHTVYLLRAVYDSWLPEYIVLDMRDGQNFNDFFGADIDALMLTLPHDTRYTLYYKNGDQMIYRRK